MDRSGPGLDLVGAPPPRRIAAGITPHPGYRDPVGFNPFRKQERGIVDLVMVVVAILATVVVVVWALLPT